MVNAKSGIYEAEPQLLAQGAISSGVGFSGNAKVDVTAMSGIQTLLLVASAIVFAVSLAFPYKTKSRPIRIPFESRF